MSLGPPSIINPDHEDIKIESSDDLQLTCKTVGYPIVSTEFYRKIFYSKNKFFNSQKSNGLLTEMLSKMVEI